jgi:hypothetical protein
MASHRSAGVMHGIEGLVADGVEVLAPNGARRRIEGVVVRQSRTAAGSDCTVIDGIPVTSVARTMVDLAAVLDEPSLQRAFDDVIRRGASRRWLRETALRSSSGRSGLSRLLALLEELGDDVAPESWFERLLEASLASPLLDGLVRQHEIRASDGRLVARCDLALPPLRLAFEGHSRRHHDSTWARRYDEGRDIAAAKLGWEIVYLGFAATRSPASVRRDMEEVAMRRARDLARVA